MNSKMSQSSREILLSDHTRAVNLKLLWQVASLPRELRDMIYREITNPWAPDDAGQTREKNDQLSRFLQSSERLFDRKSPCPGPPCKCLKNLPHFINLNFMGGQIASEVLQQFRKMLYSDNPHATHFRIAGCHLDAFVHANILHVSIMIHEVVQKIDLVFDLGDDYVKSSDNHECKAWMTDAEQLRKAAEVLQSIPFEQQHPHLTFRLKIFQRDMTFAELQNVLEVFSPVFLSLHERGVKFNFEFCSELLDMNLQLLPQAWNLSKKEWKKNLRRLNKFWLRSSEEYKIEYSCGKLALPAQLPTLELIKRCVYHMGMETKV